MKKSLLFTGLLFSGALFQFSCSDDSNPSGSGDDPKTAETKGTFTDTRDGKIYKWTKIGSQIWMAENLNFGIRVSGTSNQADATASSADKYCYDNDDSNCDIYGGLYQWHSAMALPYSCHSQLSGTDSCIVTTPHRGICPAGWHVPAKAEWATLDAWIDADNGGTADDAGKSLKSISGWNDNGNGDGGYDWQGLPGGVRGGGGFSKQGDDGFWWSASEYDASNAWSRHLYNDSDFLYEFYYYKNYFGFSVRCVKD